MFFLIVGLYIFFKSWVICYLLCFSLIFCTFFNILYIGKKGFFFVNGIFLNILMFKSNILFYNFFIKSNFFFYDFFTIYWNSLNLFITWSFFLDFNNFAYVNLTLTIGSFVYFYTYSYMRHEILIERFLFLLLFFLYGMIWLLLSNNLFSLLIGWEIIGITSYFLINFWVTKITTFKAAFKAFIFNRLSDVNVLLLFFLFFSFFKNYLIIGDLWNLFYFNFVYVQINWLKISSFDILSIFILIAASCKSAQFGFHIWLPDSMEAPVPASSLIHSATLVSAGIYIFNKFWIILYQSFFVYYFFFLMVSWTSWYGSLIAIYQTDLKRILAYSTISHCGVLFLISYLNNLYITIFYLYSHGLFKSLSFMCVGNIIQTNSNIQDYRFMGQRFKFHKFEFFFLIFSMVNLSGYFLTLGFFTKHYLLNNIIWLNFFFIFNFFLFLGTAIIGFWYTYLLIFYVFFSFLKSNNVKVFLLSTSYSSTTPNFQTLVISLLGIYTIVFLLFFSFFIYFSKFFDLNFFFNNCNFYIYTKQLIYFNIFNVYFNIFNIYFFLIFFLFSFFKNYLYIFVILVFMFIKLFLIF